MNPGQIAVIVIIAYLCLLIGLGVLSNRFFRGTAADYFLASRGIGSFLLLMSLFGTTMTAFALIGSTGEAFASGIGVYGKMVSWSGIFHSFCFLLIGVPMWSYGKRFGYTTQIQFFRDRFESDKLGLLLFPALVGLVIPYLLIGVIGGGTVVQNITAGAFPDAFASTRGGIPFQLGAAVICLVVMFYVFFGGVRGTAWANAFQTMVFIVLGLITFLIIAHELGGVENATRMVAEYNPSYLKIGASEDAGQQFAAATAAFEAGQSPVRPREPEQIPPLVFFTYLFIPFSVGMFPHLYQHWLTAKSARTFRLALVAHPLLMMATWLPCVLIGVWATSAVVDGQAVVPPDFSNANAVLPLMVRKLAHPVVGALLTAGILAAIMSSLDSQFLCLGSIFTNDIVAHYIEHDTLSDRMRVIFGRVFVIAVVVTTYIIAITVPTRSVFALGVWCFTGFASLAPLAFAALYWKRATKAGAYACVFAAAGMWVYLFGASGWGADGDYLFHLPGMPAAWGMQPVAANFVVAAVALVVVSLLTPAPSEATLAKFFQRSGGAVGSPTALRPREARG